MVLFAYDLARNIERETFWLFVCCAKSR